RRWTRCQRGRGSCRVARVEELPSLLPRRPAVANAWLEDTAGDEKVFSPGSYDPDYLARFPAALVEAEGQIVAFANLWQAPAGACHRLANATIWPSASTSAAGKRAR
ncbi:phosphatidylglycerol lysyltransferase domain-containing protein, partial [Stenotrophomonas sp. MB339]|uniref:phosphatidylglycerol lysyltransferase domain-containing protein n=1 Tax=Stenotrophomonas sp. MB339 TaxID=1663558 RepID=UPI00209B15DE